MSMNSVIAASGAGDWPLIKSSSCNMHKLALGVLCYRHRGWMSGQTQVGAGGSQCPSASSGT
jgi:hypothetical protein